MADLQPGLTLDLLQESQNNPPPAEAGELPPHSPDGAPF